MKNENTMRKGPHTHYRTEAVLGGFQLSNSSTDRDYDYHP